MTSTIEEICKTFRVLDGQCSCGQYMDCGSNDTVCFYPYTKPACRQLCVPYEPAWELCGCTLDKSVPNAPVYLVPENGVCGNCISQACPEGCFHSKRRDYCYICKDGYYKSGGKCFECGDGCWQCDGEETCENCEYGYELIDGFCYPCLTQSSKLNECEDPEELEKCVFSMYYDHKTRTCEPCLVEHCATCETDNQLCDLCFSGEKSTNECSRCNGDCTCVSAYGTSEHCSECNYVNLQEGGCASCSEGYALDALNNCVESKKEVPSKELMIIIISISSGTAVLIIIIVSLAITRKKLKSGDKFIMFWKPKE